eukprot:g2059.t1
MSRRLSLGLDSSTQSLSATIVRLDKTDEASALTVVFQESINFDKDLPRYKTKGGFNVGAEGSVDPEAITAPTLMWVEALDLMMEKIKAAGLTKDIVCISGSGQQHGSVYWAKGSEKLLHQRIRSGTLLNEKKEDESASHSLLVKFLQKTFAKQHSPIWADSTTGDYCTLLERGILDHEGEKDTTSTSDKKKSAKSGAHRMMQITGCQAFERFTLPQILKIAHKFPSFMENTERIGLVSSFMCTLLLGAYAPIDFSDGSGMNLFDIRKKVWSEVILRSLTGDKHHHNDSVLNGVSLKQKLGSTLVPSDTILGKIGGYWVTKYGFNAECSVVAWSGDNPCSFAGLGLGKGDCAISLGTSDTLMLAIPEAPTKVDGMEGSCVFVSPTNPKEYMSMLCYRNGSLTRENIKERYCNGSWEIFGQHLSDKGTIGNGGKVGFYFDMPEILPKCLQKGYYFFDKEGNRLTIDKGDAIDDILLPHEHVRACVESHFLLMRLHSKRLGLDTVERLIITGGASVNKDILKIIANIFGCDVWTTTQTDSASLGAAYRAAYALSKEEKEKKVEEDIMTYAEFVESAVDRVVAERCDSEAHQIYSTMLNNCKWEKMEMELAEI